MIDNHANDNSYLRLIMIIMPNYDTQSRPIMIDNHA